MVSSVSACLVLLSNSPGAAEAPVGFARPKPPNRFVEAGCVVDASAAAGMMLTGDRIALG